LKDLLERGCGGFVPGTGAGGENKDAMVHCASLC
jgi:hypothetical protein